jgi:hypothetical protein
VSVRRIRSAAALGLLVGALSLAPSAVRAAVITIVNNDGATEGFNDPAPATPVGGNTGTTVGQQRLIAFQHAADIWGSLLDSDVEIRVRATFDPLDCSADSAALGQARPSAIVSHSPNAPVDGVWYAVALASKFAGADVTPGSDDITTQFNSRLGEAGCLEGSGWYYGLDNAHGDSSDLVAVLLHELGHGLGFLTLVDDLTGAEFGGQPDVFETMIFDTEANRHWHEMTAPERASSAGNTGSLVWDGPAVTATAPGVLGPFLGLTVTSPAAIAGDLDIGLAQFGADLTADAIRDDLVRASDASDAAGPETTDACSPLTNAAAIAGRVALVDRGTCTFVEKAANVQAAGAIALIVADNVGAAFPPGMAGVAPEIEIPVVSVTRIDGATLTASLGAGVEVALGANPRRRAGAGTLGRPLLYTPNPVEPGSSTSHWDTSATPNLLMEPNLSSDLTHEVDLTLQLLRDIGWRSDDSPAPAARGTAEATEADRAPREVVRP